MSELGRGPVGQQTDHDHHPHDPEFRYCPACGGQLESRVLKPNEPGRLVCSGCHYVLYLDPKVVVCVLVERQGKILLLRRSQNPQKGRWVMPGGYADRGEELTEAAIRETAEECGLEVRIKELLGVYSYPGRIAVVIVYLGEKAGGDLISGDETMDVGWFPKGEIPWDRLAFQSTVDALTDYLAKTP